MHIYNKDCPFIVLTLRLENCNALILTQSEQICEQLLKGLQRQLQVFSFIFEVFLLIIIIRFPNNFIVKRLSKILKNSYLKNGEVKF